VKSGEEYSEVREMQQQLREAQHVIAQFYQESKGLKRKLAEKASDDPDYFRHEMRAEI
jgi:phage shock protein A